MAWDWSSSPEAYAYAERQLRKKGHGTLAVIYAEIRAHESPFNNEFSKNQYHDDTGEGFNQEVYGEELAKAKKIPKDILADFIWRFMEVHRTCDNGGWNAYCCPSGCHTVPFGPERRNS